MKAAYYATNGGPEVLQYGDVPDPKPGPSDVLIRVEVISLEGGDLLHRRGAPPSSPFHVGGYQAAGIVEAVGAAVTAVGPGDRVVGQADHGSHAELFVVPESRVFRVPAGLDFERSAPVPVIFGTASDALFEFGGLRRGETVLVHGAAGGVGVACVQLAKQAGAQVLGTARGLDRLERLVPLGLDHGIDPTTDDIAQRTLEITDGHGADVVVDMVGGRSIPDLFNALAPRGRISAVGASSGEPTAFLFTDLLRKNATVHGVYLGLELHTPRVHTMVKRMFDEVAADQLVVPIDRTFALADAVAAHEYAEQGHPFGRVLLRP